MFVKSEHSLNNQLIMHGVELATWNGGFVLRFYFVLTVGILLAPFLGRSPH